MGLFDDRRRLQESCPIEGDRPVAEILEHPSGILSRTGHVKPCLNPGGPPSKAKY